MNIAEDVSVNRRIRLEGCTTVGQHLEFAADYSDRRLKYSIELSKLVTERVKAEEEQDAIDVDLLRQATEEGGNDTARKVLFKEKCNAHARRNELVSAIRESRRSEENTIALIKNMRDMCRIFTCAAEALTAQID